MYYWFIYVISNTLTLRNAIGISISRKSYRPFPVSLLKNSRKDRKILERSFQHADTEIDTNIASEYFSFTKWRKRERVHSRSRSCRYDSELKSVPAKTDKRESN